MTQSLKETIDHISCTPGSFALVNSTDRWPLPLSTGASSDSSSCPGNSAGSRAHASTSSLDRRDGTATCTGTRARRRVHIAVLDSSFNPPTLAHQAIAFSSFPPPTPTTTLASGPLPPRSVTGNTADDPPQYNARLLLFSARNVEKTLQSSDATPEQRVEMMSTISSMRQRSNPEESIGVGLINEPTFVGKAAIVRSYLASLPHLKGNDGEGDGHGDGEVEVDISFLVGTDTLVRFFDPRFYPPGEMESKIAQYFAPYHRQSSTSTSSNPTSRANGQDSSFAQNQPRLSNNGSGSGAYLVSARRGKDPSDRALEEEIINRDGISHWAQAGKVRLLGTGHEGWEEISSTRVRKAVKLEDWDLVEKLVGKDIGAYMRSAGLYAST
ncbi:hypothetical protein I316_00970 [Kwoniella heveanensis BCC8398]|uniref:Nicotinamide-nucleotide adenylyltransferase n=1 Tax=Kwoniella heveanensis BCC8398 TaxID=1296120 RepID=A0A1B9H1B5_9TREE|nr:hypothetical protein I316_00970 [Kwoniella heveanensis BCC8398]